MTSVTQKPVGVTPCQFDSDLRQAAGAAYWVLVTAGVWSRGELLETEGGEI